MQQACEGKDSFEFSLSLHKQVSKLYGDICCGRWDQREWVSYIFDFSL
jgi:hypothetical protein